MTEGEAIAWHIRDTWGMTSDRVTTDEKYALRLGKDHKFEVQPLYTAPPKEAEPWRPIETAPKDGTLIMVGKAGCGVSLVRWMLDTWIDEQGFTQGLWPSHWMPLPSPPDQKKG